MDSATQDILDALSRDERKHAESVYRHEIEQHAPAFGYGIIQVAKKLGVSPLQAFKSAQVAVSLKRDSRTGNDGGISIYVEGLPTGAGKSVTAYAALAPCFDGNPGPLIQAMQTRSVAPLFGGDCSDSDIEAFKAAPLPLEETVLAILVADAYTKSMGAAKHQAKSLTIDYILKNDSELLPLSTLVNWDRLQLAIDSAKAKREEIYRSANI